MDRPEKSLADYVAIAISPALIMALVGSLVFFLLEVVYQGRYQGSLQHILFFFVFGAVLVARISMQGGISERAGLYGLILGLVTWLALLRYVEYPADSLLAPWGWAINIGLIGIIWWSAHRLTWDCTLIDDEVDASGTGLLESAGLEKPAGQTAAEPTPGPANAGKKRKQLEGLLGWLERYRRYREERKKQPHTPGVWVVYFSLAALPLFGLGQSQIPADETARRQYAFQLMCVYVGSGLGLLLTTSFLGLRRYLRQRNLRMPAGITTAWLSLGAFLIAVVLCLGALLPRPADPQPFFNWPRAGSRDRDASAFAQVGEGKEKRKDEKASKTEKGGKDGDSKQTSKDGNKADGNDDKGKGSEKGSQKGKQQSGKQDKGADKAKDTEKKDASGGSAKDDGSKGQQAARDKDKDKAKEEQEKKGGTGQGKDQPPPKPPGASMSQIAAVLKWIVIGILVLLVVFFLLRSGLRFLANFTDWARRLLAAFQAWWQGLGALWQRKPQSEDQRKAEEARVPPRPFSAYPNPFLSGRADGMSPGELVHYSFEALEAWAREQGLARQEPETPGEFAHRLGEEVPRLEKGADRLTGYYASLAYARGNLPETCREPLRKLWQTLGERPGSVHHQSELMNHVDA
jgi:hypothetical protein